ncbi:MAG TPA: N-acetylmuramoyl-L-alanine amidase [Acidimicrobiia bacterium]|nr:N-acetylmuramoyl-L-alanine amidase [Acidimicrobiia bacterium]
MSPSEWGATVDYDTKSWTPWVPDKLVVHWGGSAVRSDAADGVPSEEEAQLRSWGSFHINTQGWLGIAYNWAIGNSGTLYRLRGENRSAATSGDEEPDGIPENQEAIAVVFMIGLGQLASEPAFDTLRQLYAERGLAEGIDRVIRHKDSSATTCPGDQLSDWVAAGGYAEETEGVNVLTIGDTGEGVADFQKALQRWAAAEGLPDPLPMFGADADYGDETKVAVEIFQGQKGLTVTGSIDGVTGALLSPFLLTTATDHVHDQYLEVGDLATVKREVHYSYLNAGRPTVGERAAVVAVTAKGSSV